MFTRYTLMFMVVLLVSACTAPTPYPPKPTAVFVDLPATEAAATAFWESRPTATSAPTNTLAPTSEVQPSGVPTTTVRHLGEMFGQFFVLRVLGQDLDTSALEVEVENKTYTLVTDPEYGWRDFCYWRDGCSYPLELFWPDAVMPIDGLAVYVQGEKEQFICFDPGNISVPAVPSIDPKSIEGAYVTLTVRSYCFLSYIELADGTAIEIATVDSVHQNGDRVDEGEAQGYAHYEYDNLWLTTLPRDGENDRQIMELARSVFVVPGDWHNKPTEEPDGPIEGCYVLNNGWFYSDISPFVVERLCGDMPFSDRYVVGNYLTTSRWLVASVRVAPVASSGRIYDRMTYQEILFEVGETCQGWQTGEDGRMVDLTYITRGQIIHRQLCVAEDGYLVIGEADQFEGVESISNVDVPDSVVVFRAPRVEP